MPVIFQSDKSNSDIIKVFEVDYDHKADLFVFLTD